VAQDTLQERLGKLNQRQADLKIDLLKMKNSRDRSRQKRMFIEYKSISRDIQVTENTLWTIDRQLNLLERSDLDSFIIETLQSTNVALGDLSKDATSLNNIEEITETLQNRMQDANEITELVSGALDKGLSSFDNDLDVLEKELDDFLNEREVSATVTTGKKENGRDAIMQDVSLETEAQEQEDESDTVALIAVPV
jgi:hypothetical protein